MADQNQNKQHEDPFQQETEMANGPVSRGASNKSAPMNDQSSDAVRSTQNADYNKLMHTNVSSSTQGSGMANDQSMGTPGGGTLPSSSDAETGTSRGGIATSDSTVSTGGSSAGRVTGLGPSRDRGTPTATDMNASTNTKGQLDKGSDDLNGEQG